MIDVDPGKELRIMTFELLSVLFKNKWKVIGAGVLGFAFGFGLSFLAGNRYKSTTLILPPKESADLTSMLLGEIGAFSGLSSAASGLGLKDPNDYYVGLLKSRSVADSLCNKFKLDEYYDINTREKTRELLAGRTFIKATKEGFIAISFKDSSRRQAKIIANAYVDELRAVIERSAVGAAREKRLFFQEQLGLANDSLVASEEKLRKYMQSNNLLSVEGGAESSIRQQELIRAEYITKSIEVSRLSQGLASGNRDLQSAKQAVKELRRRLSEFEGNGGDGIIGNKQLAERSLEYFRKVRETKYRGLLVEVLAKQYEMSRVDEVRSHGYIGVIDSAESAESRDSPIRRIWAIVGGFIGAVGMSIYLVGRKCYGPMKRVIS
ncbi:MAG: hypothetical protein IPO40_04295 [Fibrobacteres bacterium]|nr:hypothetical protein [Fibrobacterota bacterium]